MSKYTTELRYICESEAGLSESAGYNDVNSIIERAIPKIFSFDFPIFDEAYRNVLCRKIIMHFYTREIGLETYGLWKLHLESKMNEIMPYYNRLYEAQSMKFNPLEDMHLVTKHNGSGSGSSGGTHSGINKFSNTPQGGLNGLLDDKYLTEASAQNGENNNAYSNTDEYVREVSGKIGGKSYSSLLRDFTKAIVNVDERVIGELECLFMGIW